MKQRSAGRGKTLLGAAILLCAGQASVAQGPVEVRLDWTPLRSVVAAWTTLREDGTARQARYIPARGQMLALTQTTLNRAEAKRLLTESREAIKRERPGGGPSPGSLEDDLIALSLFGPGAPQDALVGPLSTFDAPTRTLLDRLLRLTDKSEKQPLAAAYLRGETLASDRLKKMRKDERIHFLHLSQFPQALRRPIRNAAKRSRDFIALTPEQATLALRLWTPGMELYLTDEPTGCAFRLYVPDARPRFKGEH